jgi:hypothetical protein
MDSVLSILGLLLQALLTVVIVYRRAYRAFPFFFTYTVYSILTTFFRLWAKPSTVSFFLWYSVTEIFYGAFALLALQEAFGDALEYYYELYRWTRAIPRLIVFALIGIPLFWALYRPYGRGDRFYASLASGTYSYVFCVRCLEILIFLLYLSLRGRYNFRRYKAGIVAGFGMYAVITLLAYVLHSYYGTRFEPLYRYTGPGAYFGEATIWLMAFAPAQKPEPQTETPELDAQMDHANVTLARYSETLRKILRTLGLDRWIKSVIL